MGLEARGPRPVTSMRPGMSINSPGGSSRPGGYLPGGVPGPVT